MASRLFEDRDLVARELKRALDSNAGLIPVLVNQATVPLEDQVPEKLRQVFKKSAVPLSDRKFSSDMSDLVGLIEENGVLTRRKRIVSLAGGLGGLAAGVVFGWLTNGSSLGIAAITRGLIALLVGFWFSSDHDRTSSSPSEPGIGRAIHGGLYGGLFGGSIAGLILGLLYYRARGVDPVVILETLGVGVLVGAITGVSSQAAIGLTNRARPGSAGFLQGIGYAVGSAVAVLLPLASFAHFLVPYFRAMDRPDMNPIELIVGSVLGSVAISLGALMATSNSRWSRMLSVTTVSLLVSAAVGTIACWMLGIKAGLFYQDRVMAGWGFGALLGGLMGLQVGLAQYLDRTWNCAASSVPAGHDSLAEGSQ